jgi:hypothetical protein
MTGEENRNTGYEHSKSAVCLAKGAATSFLDPINDRRKQPALWLIVLDPARPFSKDDRLSLGVSRPGFC